MMPIQQEAIGLKRLQLYPLAGSSGRVEKRILPGGSSAAVMWANGLGSTQTTHLIRVVAANKSRNGATL